MLAARKLAFLCEEGGINTLAYMTAARRLIFTKGNDSHDYKFSSAALETIFYPMYPRPGGIGTWPSSPVHQHGMLRTRKSLIEKPGQRWLGPESSPRSGVLDLAVTSRCREPSGTSGTPRYQRTGNPHKCTSRAGPCSGPTSGSAHQIYLSPMNCLPPTTAPLFGRVFRIMIQLGKDS